MKKLFLKLFVLSFLAINLISCEDDSSLIIKPSENQFSILTPNDNETIFLNKDYPNNPALTISWESAQYDGSSTQITYSVEVDKDGDNFDTPIVLGTSSNRSITFKVSELNTSCSLAGLSPNVLGTLNIRIKSAIGTVGTNIKYSNVINYSVTPYLSYLFKDYFLVGSATAPGWSNNNNNPPLWRNPSNKDLYEFTGYFVGGGTDNSKFKLLETLGLWQPQWGSNGGNAQSGSLAGNPATQSGDPGEFIITGASGYYKFSVNMATNTRTFSIAQYAGSTATTYTTIGLIGTAVGGWSDSNEIAMTQVSSDPHLWFKKEIVLANGQLKFRANATWSGKSWGATTEYSGQGTGTDDPNIPVTGTKYNVWFNDLTGQYMLIPVLN